MAKRINISIPDEMFVKLSELKNEFVDFEIKHKKVTRMISHVCQEALSKIIEEAEVSRIYRMEGLKDGEIGAQSLSQKDKDFIFNVLGGQGLYKKWSRFDKVSLVNDRFDIRPIYKKLAPKFTDLMDGKIILHEWVEESPQKEEDRRSEMSWSYIEGCFEGVVVSVAKEKDGEDGHGKDKTC